MFSLMRLAEEPCVWYNEKQIHELLVGNIRLFMDYLWSFYLSWSEGLTKVILPEKQVFTTPGIEGDFRVMPCLITEHDKMIKMVKVIGTNEEEQIVHDKISVGKALLLHPKDNFVQAIFDVCALSSFRTAAVSVLAFKKCCPDYQNLKVGIIGTGRIGIYTGLILVHWLGLNELTVTDIKPERIEDFKKIISLFTTGINVVDKNLSQLSQACDVVFLCTKSPKPVFGQGLAEGIGFISSVGADADNLSEIEASVANGRQIVVDHHQSTKLGDLKRWIMDGLLKSEQIIELKDLFDESIYDGIIMPIIFISTGIAIQDALICQFLFEHLNKEGNINEIYQYRPDFCISAF